MTGLLAPSAIRGSGRVPCASLLSDEELWQSFHRAGPQRVEQCFDLATQTALLEKIYSGILATK